MAASLFFCPLFCIPAWPPGKLERTRYKASADNKGSVFIAETAKAADAQVDRQRRKSCSCRFPQEYMVRFDTAHAGRTLPPPRRIASPDCASGPCYAALQNAGHLPARQAVPKISSGDGNSRDGSFVYPCRARQGRLVRQARQTFPTQGDPRCTRKYRNNQRNN